MASRVIKKPRINGKVTPNEVRKAMADMKLKNCPWCAAGTTLVHENKGVWDGTKGYGEPISVEVQHWCEKEEGQPSPRRLVFVGRDAESAIRIWNTRATDPTIEAQEAEIKRLRDDVSMLWMLLDDIDTLDDSAKDNDTLFRKACYKIQQKRWKIKDPFFMEQAALKKEE